MTRHLIAAIDVNSLAGLLADATAKATVLLLLTWLLTILLRRRSAALRHRLWAMALIGMIVMPAASWLVPGWRLPILPEPSPPVSESRPMILPAISVAAPVLPPPSAPVQRKFIRAPMAGRVPPDHPDVSGPAAPLRRPDVVEATPLPSRAPFASWSIPGGWLTIWGLGVLAAGLPTLLGLLGNGWIRQRSRPVTDADWLALLESLRDQFSIRRHVALVQGDDSPIPMTWGIVRPLILLPDDASGWPTRKRRLVLLHELAHIRRFDAAVQLAGRLAAAIYWFHPLAWYALHRLRVECEHASDDCVVLAGERSSDYASELLDLARSVRAPRLAMTIAMARTNVLEDRLTAMFDETRSHRPLDARSGRWLAIGAAALVLALAMVHPGPSAARPGPAAPAPAVAESPAIAPTAPAVAEPPTKGTGRISGRVVRDGQAAQSAEVVLLLPPPKGRSAYMGKLPLRRTTTDATGAFAFDGLTPGVHRVWANLGKMTSRPRRSRGDLVILPESGAAPGPVELRLVPAVAATVRITDKATGKPIAGATVQPGWSDFVDDFTTDRNGRVQAQPFTRERWRLDVWADGFAKQSRWINLENGSDAELEFALDRGGDLEGVVRDPSGKPVSGAGLSVFTEGSFEQVEYVKTDAQGRYRLPHLPLHVGLRLQTYERSEFDQETISTQAIGPRQTLDLTLRPRPHGGSIAGIVRDPQGRPIAGAELINPGNSSSQSRRAKSGPDGRFLLDNLFRTITGKEVIVRAKGFAPKRFKVEPGPAEKPAEVDIAMEPGHRLDGRVTDDKGRPIEGVRVYFGGTNHANQGGGQTTTDAQGRFTFDSLPPETSFAFYKGGFSEIDNRSLLLDTGDVVTVVMAPSGVVVGRVFDRATGRPIRKFNVQLAHSSRRQAGDPDVGLRSDLGGAYQSDDGRFQVGDLVVGLPIQVMVSAEGYERGVAERVVIARPDEAQVEEIRLERLDPASLRTYHGRLRDAAGQPVVGAQVRLIVARDRDPNGRIDFPFNWSMIRNGQLAQQSKVVRFLASTTDARGIFEFTGIPKGTEVELAWWGKGIAPGRADHLEHHAENRDGWFDLTLPAPARIAGRVDRKTYTTAGRVQVMGPIGLSDYPDVELKPDQAEFQFEDLAPGVYTVNLTTAFERDPSRPGALTLQTLATAQVTLEAGQTGQIDFKP